MQSSRIFRNMTASRLLLVDLGSEQVVDDALRFVQSLFATFETEERQNGPIRKLSRNRTLTSLAHCIPLLGGLSDVGSHR